MKILQLIFSVAFFHSVLRVSTPLILASFAALISDKAGVVNIGIEGTMLSAALTGVLVSAATGSALVGVIGAVIVGILLSLMLAYFSLNLKTNLILSGIALDTMASGGTIFVLYLFAHDKGTSSSLKSMVVPNVVLPLIDKIPVLGGIISNQNILTYLALISILAVYILINKTPLGLRIRSVGENPNAVKSVGVSVLKTQYIALVLSGVFSALGGAFMSMGYLSWFSRDMVSGRGFIALAAEAMGRGTPIGTAVSAIFFGFADALSNSLQSLRIPSQFVQMIPYVVTILGIVLYSIQQAAKLKKSKGGSQ